MAAANLIAGRGVGFRMNTAPPGFEAQRDLPRGFLEFFSNLHRRFTPWQQELIAERRRVLEESLEGNKPAHCFPSGAVRNGWRIELPDWCQDQRNQVMVAADDTELVVKMLNCGAPGIILDLEDMMANEWEHHRVGIENILATLAGTLAYFDNKREQLTGIQPSPTVIWIRPRGLHLHQAGIVEDAITSAALFDVARIAYQIDPAELKHPLSFYIPKSESAEEALWWRDLFKAVAEAQGWSHSALKCMALVESHPLAFQMEEFLYNLRDHILGLAVGRRDYMASLIHFNLYDPDWVLPDRNTIAHDVPFLKNLEDLMPEVCHKRGVLAIGSMTTCYPCRQDVEWNARALKVLAGEKRSDADGLMDGARTGHPDQSQIALDQFPYPNQLERRRAHGERYPDLRPRAQNLGQPTLAGTRAAVRAAIRYRNGLLNGLGASLLDGSIEDLASDRIYRLMIAQRMCHSRQVPVVDEAGNSVAHTRERVRQLFDEELENLLAHAGRELGTPETFRQARRVSEAMIMSGEIDPL
ncbi:MAG: hypothetical protein JO249_11250 [Acidobacteria bacterium]|nr:hypothetical protein [Acidobacteriota bacterium]